MFEMLNVHITSEADGS